MNPWLAALLGIVAWSAALFPTLMFLARVTGRRERIELDWVRSVLRVHGASTADELVERFDGDLSRRKLVGALEISEFKARFG